MISESAATLQKVSESASGLSCVASEDDAATRRTNQGPEATASKGGSFFETLTSSEFYKNTKVGLF